MGRPKLSTKLEAELNLAPVDSFSLDNMEETPAPATTEIVIPEPATVTQYEDLDKIAAALPIVRGLESTDEELDKLADYAVKAHQDLMDLSLNVDQKHIGEIAGAASSYLGHAITAKTNKIKKKLDMISLQIKKQLADAKTKAVDIAAGKVNSDDDPLEGAGVVLDRNQMLAELRKGKA